MKLNSFLYRIFRLPCSHGFGIQSPFAFNFVTKVVRGKAVDSQFEVKSLSKDDRKIASLCSRIMRAYDYNSYYEMLDSSVSFASFMNNDHLVNYTHHKDASVKIDFAVVDLRIAAADDVENVIQRMDSHSCLLLLHLYERKETLSLWRKCAADVRTGVSFDMYSCGALFFDKKLYKRLYKIYY